MSPIRLKTDLFQHCFEIKKYKIFSVFLYRVIETRVEVWENEKFRGNSSTKCEFSTQFRNLHEIISIMHCTPSNTSQWSAKYRHQCSIMEKINHLNQYIAVINIYLYNMIVDEWWMMNHEYESWGMMLWMSGAECYCDVTLSIYLHRAGWKIRRNDYRRKYKLKS